jgi:hypothetical protein
MNSAEKGPPFTAKLSLESYRIAALQQFGYLLRVHLRERRWHYGVLLDDNNPNSLASFLQLSNDDLKSFLILSGLATMPKNGIIRILPKEWNRFLIEFGIKEVVYFDKMKVTNIPDRNGNYFESKQWWIGVGCSSKFKKQFQSNPSSQFKHYSTPPRIKKSSAIRQVKYLIDSYHYNCEDNENDDSRTTASSSKTSDRLIAKINEEEDIEQNKSIKNLTFILQQLEGGATTKEKSIELIIASIQESRLQAQQRRMKLIEEAFNQEQHQGGNSVTSEEDEVLLSEEETKIKAPFLHQFRIPIKKSTIQIVLKEIVAVSNAFPKKKLLSYTHWNGQRSNLMSIPICKNEESFLRTNRGKSKWLDNLPSLIVGNDNNGDDESKAAGWVLNRFGSLFENEFVATAEKMGYSLTSKTMPVATAEAMWQEANVNLTQQRTILRYMRGTFGKRCMIPGEKYVAKEETKIIYEHVNPICNQVKLGKEKVHYWTKPIIPALNYSMTSRLLSSHDDHGKYNKEDIHKFDFVLGGDHGQRQFRMVMKIIARAADDTVLDSWVIKVAQEVMNDEKIDVVIDDNNFIF